MPPERYIVEAQLPRDHESFTQFGRILPAMQTHRDRCLALHQRRRGRPADVLKAEYGDWDVDFKPHYDIDRSNGSPVLRSARVSPAVRRGLSGWPMRICASSLTSDLHRVAVGWPG